MPEDPELPIDFLLSCSSRSLEDFELSSLNRAALKRRALREVWLELVEAEAQALFARWLIDHRAEIAELGSTRSLQKTLDFSQGSIVNPKPVLGPKKSSDADAGNEPGELSVG